MKTPRDLSGRSLADGLCRHWDYRQVHQSGSHIILQTEDPSHQRISIPAHDALRVGTLNSLLKLVAEHKRVSRDKILQSIL
jgi:predicted RNA binding protein YcfA (HicA-like mRNA interferase family)